MNTDQEYFRLLDLILTKGKRKKNRTGTDTIGVFGAQARFDLSTFPLLTSKRMAIKSITHELLWFIKGDTNIKYLVDNGCNIWNDDAYRNYLNICKSKNISSPYSKEEYIKLIKSSDQFANQYGDLGQGTYGQMWRRFPYFTETEKNPNTPHMLDRGSDSLLNLGVVDQLTKVLNKLKTNPDDRRMIVSAWHPYWVDHCALPPCHTLFHFNTEELTVDERVALAGNKINAYTPDNSMQFNNKEQEDAAYHRYCDQAGIPRRRLNCLLYQRSCDTFLGVPFNIASYGMLISMVAQVTNMLTGEFVHTYGDLHIYENHISQCKEQMTREPKAAPRLVLNPNVKSLFDFKFEDISIADYEPHPPIKGELSTG